MNKRFTQYFKNTPKYIPILGAFLGGVVIASIIYFVSRTSPKADDELTLRAARVERIDGDVGIARPETKEDANADTADSDWEEATRNAPLSTGDRIYAREGSRAAVALTGRNYARLDSGSALDVLSLADRRTQLALHNGSAIFDVGELEDGELFEVATPNCAFDINEPGLYQMGINDDGNTWISVLSGLAQVTGVEGSRQISQGEMLTLVGQAASQILLSRFSDDYAGEIVDDYYDYRYDDYDGRYRNYSVYRDDPYYYSSHRRSVSYDYIDEDIPGVYDLDEYGDWSDVDGYGKCWAPRVDSDWVPYRDGYWDVGSSYGPTWVSQEAWGWAPYHYGRWAYVNQRQWVWVPERTGRRHVYAPALVAFVPITQSNQIGWVPLAPGERYIPRYYDNDFQPRYFASRETVNQVINVRQTYVNYNYPQAVTVIGAQDFTRPIDRRRLAAVNPQAFAQVQPVLDPYAIASVRNMAAANENDRPKFKMSREQRRQAFNNSVVTSVKPVVIPGRENINQRIQVATVPEKQRKNKLKVQESGQVADAGGRPGLARQPVAQTNSPDRQQQIAALAARSAQGDREARRELKRLSREQNADPQRMQNPMTAQPAMQGREGKPANDQPPNGAVVNPQKAQRQLERQQRRAMAEQQNQKGGQPQNQKGTQPLLDQAREQRRAQKQAAQQQAAPNPQAEQRRAQKQAAREQQVNRQRQMEQQQQQQQQVQQQRQQMKQQRKQEQRRVPPPQQQMQQQQVNQAQQQQMKQQRRMQEQQQMQQRQQAPPPAAQQMKQQRRAERQAAQQQQQVRPQVVPQQQPRVNRPAPQQAPPANPSQRQMEKAQRKAGKGNQ